MCPRSLGDGSFLSLERTPIRSKTFQLPGTEFSDENQAVAILLTRLLSLGKSCEPLTGRTEGEQQKRCFQGIYSPGRGLASAAHEHFLNFCYVYTPGAGSSPLLLNGHHYSPCLQSIYF